MPPPGAPRSPADGSGAVDLVLSAESTDVGVRRTPRERVRVRREVVTEDVTVVVTVRREVLRLEREPVTADLPEQDPGGALPLELVLSEERPVVQLEVVPYERVRVGVRSVPGSASVSTDVRREVADLTTHRTTEPTTERTTDRRSTP